MLTELPLILFALCSIRMFKPSLFSYKILDGRRDSYNIEAFNHSEYLNGYWWSHISFSDFMLCRGFAELRQVRSIGSSFGS